MVDEKKIEDVPAPPNHEAPKVLTASELKKIELFIESDTWKNLEKLHILKEGSKAIKSAIYFNMFISVLKFVEVIVIAVFTVLYTVKDSQVNRLLGYVSLGSSSGVNLSLPILSKVSTTGEFKKLLDLTTAHVYTQIDSFWNYKSSFNLFDRLERLHYLKTIKFQEDLSKNIEKRFNKTEMRLAEELGVEFDNLIAVGGKSKKSILIRRAYFSLKSGQFIESLKLLRTIEPVASDKFHNLSTLFILVRLYESNKGDYKKVFSLLEK